jgi:hypothetical protein
MAAKDTLLQALADSLIRTMREQLERANHRMTGSLIESLESQIKTTVTGATIEIWMNDYGLALNNGVPPSRIPFTPPSGRGGTSKYIEGLKRFAELKLGISDPKKALGVAFAIARKQKEKGLPIAGPSRFIEGTLEIEKQNIEKFVQDWAAELFEAQIELLIAA